MDKSLTGMESLSVDEMGDLVHDFYNSINDLMAKNSCFKSMDKFTYVLFVFML